MEKRAIKLASGHWKTLSRVSIVYYYIFEDANFHTLNEQMTRKGLYGPFKQNRYDDGKVISSPKSYGKSYVEYNYKEYKKSGGRTWELF